MKPLRSQLRHARLALPIITLLLVASVPLHQVDAVRLAQIDTTVHVYLPLVSAQFTPPLLFNQYLDGDYEIYVMKPDGSGQTNLTNNAVFDGVFSWSPRNRKIAFISKRGDHYQIYTMNLDGSGLTQLTNTPRDYYELAWSPDGTKIAFSAGDGSGFTIYVMNADGSGQTKLTTGLSFHMSWSPDSTRLVFSTGSDIYVMSADGSNLTKINHQPASGTPTWSPNGQQIAFPSSYDDPYCPNSPSVTEMALARPDGSSQTRLTHTYGSCRGSGIFISPWWPLVWSPSGDRIAFVGALRIKNKPGNYEIYTINADGSNTRNLTNSDGYDRWPVWSPLGDQLAFTGSLGAAGIDTVIFTVNADGSGMRQLTDICDCDYPIWAE
jgi:Tol biopolymer transport system component